MKEFIKDILKTDWLSNKALRLLNYIEKERLKQDRKKLISKLRTFGTQSRINGEVRMIGPKSIIIGNNVHIGDGGHLDGRGGLIIGDNTHISRNLTIYTTNHHYRGDFLPYDQRYQAREVVIGKNVWIGMDVSITPGVHIGDGAIIGMGSVVSKDVNRGEIVVSNKQRVIGKRDDDSYQSKEQKGEYGGISGNKISTKGLNEFLGTPFEAQGIVFVLSTGRSGSKTMARMFKDEVHISAFHETFYYIISRVSIEYLTGRMKREEAKKKLITYFRNTTLIKRGTIYLESDQKLSPFIGILNDIFENPKFIWIVRHPKTFMHSAYSRGWYAEDSPEFLDEKVLVDPKIDGLRTRISGFLTGEYSKDEWQSLDQRKKILWYWKYWNNMIEDGIKIISENNKLFLKMENIDKDYERIKNFLDIEGKRTIPIRKHNSVSKGHVKKYKKEKDNNYRYFEKKGYKLVEKEMNKMGYSID